MMASVMSTRPWREPLARDGGDLALAALAALPQTSVIVVDAQLRIVLAAGRALAAHGIDGERLEGRLLADALVPAYVDHVMPAVLAALDGRPSAVTYETVDGTRTYEVDAAPVRRET